MTHRSRGEGRDDRIRGNGWNDRSRGDGWWNGAPVAWWTGRSRGNEWAGWEDNASRADNYGRDDHNTNALPNLDPASHVGVLNWGGSNPWNHIGVLSMESPGLQNVIPPGTIAVASAPSQGNGPTARTLACLQKNIPNIPSPMHVRACPVNASVNEQQSVPGDAPQSRRSVLE